MLFTIGTSNRSLSEFLYELRRRNITSLIDVRSQPYSRLAWFNAGQIVRWAERAGIMYRRAGEVLGGKSETSLNDTDFQSAVDGLIDGASREHIAIFCAEGDPAMCHRSYKVGAAILQRHGVAIQNICRDGSVEDIRRTLCRTSAHLLDPSVFALRSGLVDPERPFLFDHPPVHH